MLTMRRHTRHGVRHDDVIIVRWQDGVRAIVSRSREYIVCVVLHPSLELLLTILHFQLAFQAFNDIWVGLRIVNDQVLHFDSRIV